MQRLRSISRPRCFSEPALKAANVDVSSHGGEVTLTWQVPDDSARLDFTLEQLFDITYLPSRKSQRLTSGQPGSDQAGRYAERIFRSTAVELT